IADESAYAPGVHDVSRLAEGLEPIDVVHGRAGNLGGAEGDDVGVPSGAHEVLDPAAGVDVGRVGEVDDPHGWMLSSTGSGTGSGRGRSAARMASTAAASQRSAYSRKRPSV